MTPSSGSNELGVAPSTVLAHRREGKIARVAYLAPRSPPRSSSQSSLVSGAGAVPSPSPSTPPVSGS
jgi:hypothetical protein